MSREARAKTSKFQKCLAREARARGLGPHLALERGRGIRPLRDRRDARLLAETAWAMTVHKAQGHRDREQHRGG